MRRDLRTLGEVAQVIVNVSGNFSIIAIAGAPGAGKSTIAAELASMLSAALLPMDGFHLPQERLVELGRRDRMGAPDTFDVDCFIATLEAIYNHSGQPVFAPGFDRTIEEPVQNAIEVPPDTDYVIVEGNYLLLDTAGWERAAPFFEVTFFVDVDDDIRIERLVRRHVEFGKSEADARAWALGPDQRNAEIIQATAARANYLIRLE